MAGHRPWPPDPTRQQGAYDYDEDTDMMARRIKYGQHFRTKADRRKPFAIESRITLTHGKSIAGLFGLDQWFIHRRYETAARRDFAFNVLVGKSERAFRGWSHTEWRKIG